VKDDASSKTGALSSKFFLAKSYYFCSNATINKTFFNKKLIYTVSNPGSSYDVYETVLEKEQYPKEFVKDHPELKEAVLTSLMYNCIFAEYNGEIKEVDQVFLVTKGNVYSVRVNKSALTTLKLDLALVPDDLFKASDGLYVPNMQAIYHSRK